MNPAPEFPQTRPIELQDKALFDGLFEKYPPAISEFTFTNLFAWRHAYQFNVSQAEGQILVVSFKGGTTRIFDPIGPLDGKAGAMRKCFSLRPAGKAPIFIRLPEDTASLFKKADGFKAEEDRDNFDYVYMTEGLIGLKGRDFDGKRNFIKRFKESYPFAYNEVTEENIKDCIFFQEEWCLAKDCQHTEGLEKERQAIKEIFNNFKYLGARGGMIVINDKVEAVTVGEPLSPDTFVIHIEKANGKYLGIYQAINQLFCEKAAAGYKYVNREQDLGVSGLRQAKESYHPHHRVKKYTLIKN